VLFLRRLVPGSANRSYGIQVARLAGLPDGVIVRAREILANLEGGELDAHGRPRLAGGAEPMPDPDQLGLFALAGPSDGERDVLAKLRSLDPDQTTPFEALSLLSQLRARLEEDA
jgi:DNA mismatch repair protein MutS